MKQFRSTGQISAHITILSIAFLTACSQPAATSTSGANRAGRSSSQGDSAPDAVVALPSPTAAASVSVDDALRPALPLAGEYAVTANRDDHSLSVVRIGLARLVATVPLDISPGAVVAAPRSDRAFAADGLASDRTIAVANLNAAAQAGKLEPGGHADQLAGPPGDGSGPLLLVSDEDNTLRPLDPATQSLGPPLPLDAGPHALAMTIGRPGVVQQVYVANSGDGTLSVTDANATAVEATIRVGGRPIGVAVLLDGRLWIADGETGRVALVDPTSGRSQHTIQVGPHLTAMAATRDGHYLVLASSDPEHALYSVDLFSAQLGVDNQVVRDMSVTGGVLAVATGAETGLAYATTADGKLIYWDLASNTVTHTIDVGQRPVALALGMALPPGSVSASPDEGGGTSGSAGGNTLGAGPSGAGSAAGAATGGGGTTGSAASIGSGGSSTPAAPSGPTATGSGTTGQSASAGGAAVGSGAPSGSAPGSGAGTAGATSASAGTGSGAGVAGASGPANGSAGGAVSAPGSTTSISTTGGGGSTQSGSSAAAGSAAAGPGNSTAGESSASDAGTSGASSPGPSRVGAGSTTSAGAPSSGSNQTGSASGSTPTGNRPNGADTGAGRSTGHDDGPQSTDQAICSQRDLLTHLLAHFARRHDDQALEELAKDCAS